MFDLKTWIREVDISSADESLDENAARLLVLNDALVNDQSGPILCCIIVTAEEGKGLDALVELADCSEPRLAMMAVVNLLNTLSEENLSDAEFNIPAGGSGSEGAEVSITRSDLPSPTVIHSKAVPATIRLADLFMKRVAENDFCCDFLTFLLTALMDLAVKCRKDSPDLFEELLAAATEPFLKTIMRTWKIEEQHLHRSEDDGDPSLTLGFLISCYLKSLVVSPTEDVQARDDVSSESTDGGNGLSSLVSLGDWGIKFMLMRLYSPSCSETERGHLFSVIEDCARRDSNFGIECLHLSMLKALSYSENSPLLSTMESNQVLTMQQTALLKAAITPQILLLITLVNVVISEHVQPGIGIWLHNKQSRISLEVATAFSIMSKRALYLLIMSQYPLSQYGQMQKKFAISTVAKLLSMVWKASVAVIFRKFRRQSLHVLRQAFHNVIRETAITTTRLCALRGTLWSQLSSSPDMAPLRVMMLACKTLARASNEWNAEILDVSLRPQTFSSQIRSSVCICEYCLYFFPDPKACGKCGFVKYCSAEHQKLHWEKGHKAECSFLRNCLEGTSVTVSNGRLQGLCRVRPESGEVGFSAFCEGQRNELLILSFRLPGLFEERVGGGVRYQQFSQKLREVAAYVNAGLLSEADLRVLWVLMKACDSSCMIYCSRSEERMTISLLSSGEEISQSISVALSFTREVL